MGEDHPNQLERYGRRILYYGEPECQMAYFIFSPKAILVGGCDPLGKAWEFLEQENERIKLKFTTCSLVTVCRINCK